MTFLIGRDHPAAALRSAVERTVSSHGGLALVTGEAGIGKSTLVTDVAARYRDELTVAFATSWESEAVPDHWLWVQVLRSLRAQFGDDTWQELHPAPAVDALLGRGDGSTPAPFELYDAVTQLLISASQHRASQRGGLLVVLDDLHFADPGSLELLKFASQHTWFERVLFVGTYRDSEIDPGHRLRARMLPLVAKATMISLEGLDEAGVAELCRTTVGDAPDPATVAEITRRTGGNPFFVEQTAQLWASGQRVDATTAGMRDALQRRIDQLPEPLVRMLTLASVGGREFHAGVMAQASGMDHHRIEAALDAACQTRLVRREQDRYVFVHDLVRETLYNTMASDEAAHHHGCVVRALVADESLQKYMLATEIAHHAWLAGDDLDPQIAVDFLSRAAKESQSCLSVDGAEKYYRRALERCTPDMVRRRVLLRLELAATVKWLQREEESWKLYDQAVFEARDSGDPMLLARTAIELPPTERLDALCRLKADAYEALTGKRPDPGLDYDGLTRQLNYEFLMAARKIGDDEEVAFGLWATHSVEWGPGTAAARQVIVEELDEITRRTGDIDMRLFAASLRWVAMLEQGDPAFRSQVDFFCALVESSDAERWHSGADIDHAIVDIVQGRWDSAAERIDKACTLAGDDLMNDHMTRHLRWELAFARGEAPEPTRDSRWTTFGVWQFDLLTALSALRRGDLDEAHRAKSRLEAEPDPHDAWISLRLRFEVELAAAEGDPEAMAALRERLEPHEGEWLVALWGTSVHGPISHWLGVLAAASGDCDRAATHFANAIEQAERLDAPPWAEAAREGLAALGKAAAATETTLDGAVFRREGSTWTLRYEGRGVHLPHTKGLADLHRLLRQRGVEVAAVDLLASESGEEVTADARLGGDDLLDAEARARYRDHLEALDEQIDTAAALGDDARAARLDAERQALIEQLKAATGLGGRSRRLGDNAERARKSVTNRIRNTLKKIEAVHPALADHLHAAVATGSACVYRPEPEAPQWEL